MRIYDTRLGKFLSVDPAAKAYPFYSPYQFAGNTPIQAIDLDGLEPMLPMAGGAYTPPSDQTQKPITDPNALKYLDSKAGGNHGNVSSSTNAAIDILAPVGIAINTFTSGYNDDGSKAGPLDYTMSGLQIMVFGANFGRGPKGKVGANGPKGGPFEGFTPPPYAPKIRNPKSEVFYRGGNTFEMSKLDIKASVDPQTGFMKERGVSVNKNKNDYWVQRKGGAFEIDLSTVPKELKFQHTDGTHYEIAPQKSGTMTLEKYQELLQQIKVKPTNTVD
jgi:hypothetical protein